MQCKYIEYSKLLTNWSLCVQHTVLFFERKTIQWDKENSLFVATHPTTVRYNSREWSMTNWPIIEVPKYSSKNPIGWSFQPTPWQKTPWPWVDKGGDLPCARTLWHRLCVTPLSPVSLCVTPFPISVLHLLHSVLHQSILPAVRLYSLTPPLTLWNTWQCLPVCPVTSSYLSPPPTYLLPPVHLSPVTSSYLPPTSSGRCSFYRCMWIVAETKWGHGSTFCTLWVIRQNRWLVE